MASVADRIPSSKTEPTEAQLKMREILGGVGLQPDDYFVNSDGSVLLQGSTHFCIERRAFVLSQSAIAVTLHERGARTVVRFHNGNGYTGETVEPTALNFFEQEERALSFVGV